MKDNVLNNFIEKILKEKIDNEGFERHIDIFSCFLGYTNPDYKYNGTYLRQYIADFLKLHQMLKNKHEKYHEIFRELIKFGYYFELLIDQSFWATYLLKSEIKYEYIEINKSKIISPKIEIRIKFEANNKEYIFCKEYDNFEESKLIEIFCNDVEKYIKIKKIGGLDHETS